MQKKKLVGGRHPSSELLWPCCAPERKEVESTRASNLEAESPGQLEVVAEHWATREGGDEGASQREKAPDGDPPRGGGGGHDPGLGNAQLHTWQLAVASEFSGSSERQDVSQHRSPGWRSAWFLNYPQ